MKPQRLEELVFAYEVGTQFPDVSGAEHLDILLIRSDIENYKSQLSHAQMERVAGGDNRLMRQARAFHIAIAQMANLAQWRREENAPSSHWWWYLDVFAYAWQNMQYITKTVSSPHQNPELIPA